MEVINTGDPAFKPSVVMLVYGEGGVGKTSFGATAPKPLLADCEGGAKYFGLRGIKMDLMQIQTWSDMKGFLDAAKSEKYETVIIDPIGELMEKLKAFMIAKGDRKLVQNDGAPTMAGWGWLKDTMRQYIKVLRDLGKHVVIIAHVDEKMDEDRLVKRPLIQTKIDKDIVNMVDIVGFMTVVQKDGEEHRVIYVDPSNDKIVCKDRTGQLGKYIPPNFAAIITAVQGTKEYNWTKKKAVAPAVSETTAGPATVEAPKNTKASVEAKIDKKNGETNGN